MSNFSPEIKKSTCSRLADKSFNSYSTVAKYAYTNLPNSELMLYIDVIVDSDPNVKLQVFKKSNLDDGVTIASKVTAAELKEGITLKSANSNEIIETISLGTMDTDSHSFVINRWEVCQDGYEDLEACYGYRVCDEPSPTNDDSIVCNQPISFLVNEMNSSYKIDFKSLNIPNITLSEAESHVFKIKTPSFSIQEKDNVGQVIKESNLVLVKDNNDNLYNDPIADMEFNGIPFMNEGSNNISSLEFQFDLPEPRTITIEEFKVCHLGTCQGWTVCSNVTSTKAIKSTTRVRHTKSWNFASTTNAVNTTMAMYTSMYPDMSTASPVSSMMSSQLSTAMSKISVTNTPTPATSIVPEPTATSSASYATVWLFYVLLLKLVM